MSWENERVYCRRGVLILERRNHTIGLRSLTGRPARLTVEQARELILKLSAFVGELDMREDLER